MKNHRILIVLTVVVILLGGYYTVLSCLSVSRYVDQFEVTYGDAGVDSVRMELRRVPNYHELLKRKGLLSSLVSLAPSDSISLFLNLPDSVAQLMIKGMGVRNITFEEIKSCALFDRASDEALYNWLAEPVEVVAYGGSIAKEPINVVQAPKDSNDEAPEVVPDTVVRPVFFWLETNRGLRIGFYQIEDGGRKEAREFNRLMCWQPIIETLKGMYRFQVPEYVPSLFIGLKREDAQVVYRALPHRGQVVITL